MAVAGLAAVPEGQGRPSGESRERSQREAGRGTRLR